MDKQFNPAVRSRAKPIRSFSSAHVHLYEICEGATGFLLGLMVIFSPWAFGTTEPWSVWTMNIAGYCLGILLLAKLFIQRLGHYQPPRWGCVPMEFRSTNFLHSRQLTRVLLGLNFTLLAYTLVAAVNAHANYFPQQFRFEYYDFVVWLPHSLDGRSTWIAFATYVSMTAVFWGTRDWLLGKAQSELRRGPNAGATQTGFPLLPARFRILLWLLAINGAALGLESIIQRLVNSPRLLFLVEPYIHKTAITQFGPYAYRANAAQYFNLLWPVCLGFWWTLNRNAGGVRHRWLLVCGAIMAACPIISTSRGGAIVAVVIIAVGSIFLSISHFLWRTHRDQDRRARHTTLASCLGFFAIALAIGGWLGWKSLGPRMREMESGYQSREDFYEVVSRMASDYPLFGTGPGSYESVSELYRPPDLGDSFWPAQVHNDWLETRITFGWVGSATIYATLAVIGLRWFAPGGIHGGRRFVTFVWLALGGCLLHARFDFPFQVYSIMFLFVLLCAALFSLSRRG